MSSLSDNTQEVLKEIFDLYKNANDGKFCRDQVANAVRAAGLVPTNEDVSRVLGIADDQNSNPISVTFEELCSIYVQLAQVSFLIDEVNLFKGGGVTFGPIQEKKISKKISFRG